MLLKDFGKLAGKTVNEDVSAEEPIVEKIKEEICDNCKYLEDSDISEDVMEHLCGVCPVYLCKGFIF